MLNKINILIIVLAFSLAAISAPALAQEQVEVTTTSIENSVETTPEVQPVYMTVFYGDGCPHCHDLFKYLDNILLKDYPNIILKKYEVWGNSQNGKLMGDIGQALGVRASGVPFTVIGRESVGGYLNDQTTGVQIRRIVEDQTQNGSVDFVGEFSGRDVGQATEGSSSSQQPGKYVLLAIMVILIFGVVYYSKPKSKRLK